MVKILYACYTKWFPKIPEISKWAGTGVSTDKWCLVAPSARILSTYAFLGGACVVLLSPPLEIEGVKEQRVRIKFYFKLGRSAAETQKIIKQTLVMTLWLV